MRHPALSACTDRTSPVLTSHPDPACLPCGCEASESSLNKSPWIPALCRVYRPQQQPGRVGVAARQAARVAESCVGITANIVDSPSRRPQGHIRDSGSGRRRPVEPPTASGWTRGCWRAPKSIIGALAAPSHCSTRIFVILLTASSDRLGTAISGVSESARYGRG